MNTAHLRRTRRLLAHFDAAYLLAVRMTRTSQDAEDVVQESFLKAARSPHLIPAGGDDDGLRKWLLKVVANTARNQHLFDAQRERRQMEAAMHAETLSPANSQPDVAAESGELKSLIAAAMAMLDEKYRVVLSLHYEQGLTHADTAEVLGLPAATIRTRASRALEQLRELLANVGCRAADKTVIAVLAGGLGITAPAALVSAAEAVIASGVVLGSTAAVATAGSTATSVAATSTVSSGHIAATSVAATTTTATATTAVATTSGVAVSLKTIVAAVALSTAALVGVTQLPPVGNVLNEVVALADVGDDSQRFTSTPIANYPPTDEEIRQMYDAEYLDPIDLNVLPIATDKSVKYDYDIVYVRAPRFGDEGKSTWAEVSRPHVMDAGADLMLLRPDGSEELLVAGGKGSVADPMVSFDGEWVYYSHFHDLTDKHGAGGGSDIYKIHVKSKRIVKLTDFGFAPNMGLPGKSGGWSTNFTKHEQGKLHLEHALYNLGPCPLPNGKVMFVSNRHGFRPPKSPGGGMPTLQLFTMDDPPVSPSDKGGTKGGTNVECIGFLNVACALHPVVLMDGRVMFSSMESEGLRTQLEWGLWTIHPDGTQWNPLVSAFATEGGAVNSFHFQTQISDGSIVFEEYYVGSNFGMGTLRSVRRARPMATRCSARRIAKIAATRRCARGGTATASHQWCGYRSAPTA